MISTVTTQTTMSVKVGNKIELSSIKLKNLSYILWFSVKCME